MNTADIPALEDWLTVPEVAETLELSRQRAHQIITNGTIAGARTIGKNAVIVVPKSAVEKYRRLNPKKGAETT